MYSSAKKKYKKPVVCKWFLISYILLVSLNTPEELFKFRYKIIADSEHAFVLILAKHFGLWDLKQKQEGMLL